MSNTIVRVWLHITAGRGPAECQLAALIEAEANAQGLTCAAIDAVEGDAKGALLSVLLSIEGAGARAFGSASVGSVL